jgi:hypothetical protein
MHHCLEQSEKAMDNNKTSERGNEGSPDLSALSIETLRTEIEARARPASAGPKSLFSIPDDPSFEGIDTPTLVKAIRDKQRLIYGIDDRKDYYDIDSVGAKLNAESVASVFDAKNVLDQGDGTSRLVIREFKRKYGLCDDEPFAGQPCGAFCSGFLVAPDVVASAGHCVDPNYLGHIDDIRFVFGFRMLDAMTPVLIISNSEIYTGKEIIHHRLTTSETDFALIRLDRAVTGHPVVRLRTSGTIATNAPLYVLGHPCGLPLKYAPGANVRRNDPKAFFSANLDTYGGNSGSPVFNMSHEVEGILVRGETDFVKRGSCRVSLVMPNSGAQGEDVTRIAEARPYIPH